MRFALIGPSAPLRGGIAQYHDRLAETLVARGHAVQRISFRRLYPQLFFPGRSQYEPPAAASAAAAHGSSATGGAAAAALPAADPLLDSLRPGSWRRAAAAAAASELAVCEWWHPFFAPALASVARRLRDRGVPMVFVCHNLEPHEAIPGGGFLARLALAQAAGFVAQSHADAVALRTRFPDRPVTIILPPAAAPPPCTHGDDRRACARALGLTDAPRRALFFGYVRAYKGLPTLIEALAHGPHDLQLLVAGEIYYRDGGFYRTLAARHGVADRIVLLDRFLGAEEVACCFNAADVVVLPYWYASQSAVVSLAMACGRPVVATAVGGLPDLVRHGETGLLVPPRDAAALADGIARALAAAPVWGAAAHAAARALSWAHAAAALEGLASAVSRRAALG